MPRLTLLIGPPASGKSTFAQGLLIDAKKLDTDLEYLNADSIRKHLYACEGIQGDGAEVFNLLFHRFREAVKSNKDIVVDNTSVRKGHRKKLLSLINSKYEVFYKVFKTPLSVCLERNSKRARKVPKDVLINFYNVLQEQLSELPKETSNIEYIGETATS